MATTLTSEQVLSEKSAAENQTIDINNDEPIITLISDSKKSSCQVHLHGATVTSWKVNDKERIFLSKKAICDKPGKGIRGGIPIVFPNFGPWACGPQHGFARARKWKIVKKSDRSASFELTENEESLKMWDHKFKLTYTVKVTDTKLLTTLEVKNCNDIADNGTDKSFDFTTLLHTYFRVSDISNVALNGFKNCEYVDALQEKKILTENSDAVKISENVDSVYFKTNDEHTIIDHTSNPPTKINIRKTNLPDTVVWNPWIEKAKAMGDFDDEEYKEMVCVEAGYVNERKVLAAGDVFICEQVLEEECGVIDLDLEDDGQETSNGCEYFGSFAK